MDVIRFVLAGMLGLAIGALVMWVRMKLRWREDLREACNRSVNVSRGTIKGQIGEQLAPLLAGFTYAAADARFLGDPIDYVVFNGYTDAKDGNSDPDEELEVVLLDIKRGRSRLSATQHAVAAAVRAGRVRFEVVRIAENGEVFVEEPR